MSSLSSSFLSFLKSSAVPLGLNIRQVTDLGTGQILGSAAGSRGAPCSTYHGQLLPREGSCPSRSWGWAPGASHLQSTPPAHPFPFLCPAPAGMRLPFLPGCWKMTLGVRELELESDSRKEVESRAEKAQLPNPALFLILKTILERHPELSSIFTT